MAKLIQKKESAEQIVNHLAKNLPALSRASQLMGMDVSECLVACIREYRKQHEDRTHGNGSR